MKNNKHTSNTKIRNFIRKNLTSTIKNILYAKHIEICGEKEEVIKKVYITLQRYKNML